MGRLGRWLAAIVAAIVVLLVTGYQSGNHEPVDQVAVGQRELGVELRAHMVPASEVRLNVVEAGPASGPPVLLLHGFPEFWWGWKAQIARLANAGFHVIVPDQRGYNASDKPEEVESYRREALTADVLALLSALHIDRVYLAGHDWGGAVAWTVVLEHPERVRRLVMFNAPHPLAWEEAAKSAAERDTTTTTWFRTFFQIPVVPEVVMRMGDWALVARNLQETSRPGTFDATELSYYKAAWARDDAMSTMVDWYRAGFQYPYRTRGDGTVKVPTRIVWGVQDRFFEPRMADLSVQHCPGGELIRVDAAGHWLLHEEPDLTSRAMIDFFHED
jgi:pimeloyl-ACP methyl ester carboxylesterase